jgi:hypothetical protein
MYPQASVEFAGIRQVLSFTGTFNHGVEPSIFLLEIVPQPPQSIALYGTLRLRYDSTVIDLPMCLVDSGSYSLNSGGEVVSLQIKDYRWRWEYANISGTYNVRDELGEIINLEDNSGQFDDLIRKTKRETVWLVNALLDAMGVQNRTIEAQIPEFYPECLWDLANASRELQDILSKLDLRLAPQLDGSVKIVSAGIGQRLPQDAIETFGNEVNPNELPQKIRVVSGPIYYTVDFPLYPCYAGPSSNPITLPFSVDGQVYDLRNDSVISGRFGEGNSDITNSQKDRLALSAFKWFRVVNGSILYFPYYGASSKIPATAQFPDMPTITLPDNGKGTPFELEFGQALPDIGFTQKHNVEFLSQFEIQDFCCERVKSSSVSGGEVKADFPLRRPFVWGAFYRESDGSEEVDWDKQNSSDYANEISFSDIIQMSYLDDDQITSNARRYICPYSFELDRKLGIVKFSDPIYREGDLAPGVTESDDQLQWPELILRCAIRVKDKQTGGWLCRERERILDPNSPAKEIVYKLEEISPFYEIDGTNNAAFVDRVLDEFINSIHINLTRARQSASATYAKWFYFNLDGAIQSMTWTMNEGGARMSLTRNVDRGSNTSLEYDMRLRKTAAKKSIDAIAAQEYQNKRAKFGL